MYRILLLIFFMIPFIFVGCGREEDMMEYEGTVISKKSTSFILLEKKIEIDQEIRLEEAFEKYGRDNVLEFSMDKEIEKVSIGDYIVVFSNGSFDDLEPPKGVVKRIEIKAHI